MQAGLLAGVLELGPRTHETVYCLGLRTACGRERKARRLAALHCVVVLTLAQTLATQDQDALRQSWRTSGLTTAMRAVRTTENR